MGRPSSGALYDEIGQGYTATRRADPEIAEALYRHVRARPTGRYLDVGCGTGNYTGALAARGGEWTGMDASRRMLDQARRARSDIHWTVADAGHIPFADGSFDGAIATLVIHHLKTLQGRLSEVRRVLRAGRLVIFTAFPEQMRRYWLCHYFPVMLERSARAMPSESSLRDTLHVGGFTQIRVVPFRVTAQLEDLFLYAGKHRPSLYLDPAVRASISSFSTLCEESELATGLRALAADPHTGAIESVVRRYESPGGDYAFVVGDTGRTP